MDELSLSPADEGEACKPANLSIARVVAPLHLSLPGVEFSVDELLAMEFSDRPLPFLTRDDVIFEGASHLLAAREKVGKSTLARHCAYTWASDGRQVLYVSEEWRRSWRKQATELGFEVGTGSYQIVEGLGRAPHDLLDRARRGSEDIVILDTATWLLGISLGSRDQVVAGLTPWLELCRRGKTLLLLSHLTKSGEAIGGSYALAAGVDTVIRYTEVENENDLRLVEVRSRLLADSPLQFAIRKIGPTFAVEDVPGELTLTAAQQEVFLVLSTDPAQARTWQQVAEATGFKEGKVRKLLRELVSLGLARDITGSQVGGRGNSARYVAVEEEEQS